MARMLSVASSMVVLAAFPQVCVAVLDQNAAQAFCAEESEETRRRTVVSTFGDATSDFAPPTAAFARDGSLLLAMTGRRLGEERFESARVLAWVPATGSPVRVPQQPSCRGEACFEEALGVEDDGTRWSRLVFPAHTVFMKWPKDAAKRTEAFDDRKLQRSKAEAQAALFDVGSRRALVWNELRRDFLLVEVGRPAAVPRALRFLSPGEQAFPLRLTAAALWCRVVKPGEKARLVRVALETNTRVDVAVLGEGVLEGVTDVFFVLEAAGAVFVRGLSGATPSVARIDLTTKSSSVVATAASLQAVSGDGRFIAVTESPKPGEPDAPFSLTVIELSSGERRTLSLGPLLLPDALTVAFTTP